MGLQTERGDGHQDKEERGQSHPLSSKYEQGAGEEMEGGGQKDREENEHSNTCKVIKLLPFLARHNAIQSKTVATGVTVTMALMLRHYPPSTPPPPSVSWSTRVIVKGTINAQLPLFLPFPVLHLKVMAFSRVCFMQNYKEPPTAAAVVEPFVSTPVTKFSRGSSLFSSIRTVGLPYARSYCADDQLLGIIVSWEARWADDTLLWETHISPNGKRLLSFHYVSIGWSHFITFRFWCFWCIVRL